MPLLPPVTMTDLSGNGALADRAFIVSIPFSAFFFVVTG
jgi:hypothetical protein